MASSPHPFPKHVPYTHSNDHYEDCNDVYEDLPDVNVDDYLVDIPYITIAPQAGLLSSDPRPVINTQK